MSIFNLRKLEQGISDIKNCNVTTVMNIAKVLGITVEELVKMYEQ